MLNNPTKAYVEHIFFTNHFPSFRMHIVMDVIVETQSDEKWKVPFEIVDKNWVYEHTSNIINYNTTSSVYQEEQEKYSTPDCIYDEITGKMYELTEEEGQKLKEFIFSTCGGEMLYKRSVVEEHMLTFCSKDFYSLSKEKRDKVFEYHA